MTLLLAAIQLEYPASVVHIPPGAHYAALGDVCVFKHCSAAGTYRCDIVHNPVGAIIFIHVGFEGIGTEALHIAFKIGVQ